MALKTKFLVVSLCIAAMVLTAGSVFAATPLYFLNHNDLPASGAIATWDGATAKGSPTATTVGGIKWENNSYASGDGFRVDHPTSSIAISGASFIVAATRGAVAEGTPWTSIIDVMYDKLTLGIKNDTGQIVVRRNGSVDNSVGTIAVGQMTVLSLVCQTDGSYEVWADGTSMLTGGANGTMTEWDPYRTSFYDEPDWASLPGVGNGNWDQWWAALMVVEPTITMPWDWANLNALPNKDTYWGYTAPVQAFKQFIDVGRNDPDGWTAFNGSIGDVKIFGEALSDADRLAEVADVTTGMGIPEPGTIVSLLAAFGGLGLAGIRRKKS
jgi:hypothetical protein